MRAPDFWHAGQWDAAEEDCRIASNLVVQSALLTRLDVKARRFKSLPYLVACVPITLLCLLVAYARIQSMELSTGNLSLGDNFVLVYGGQPPFEFRQGILYFPNFGWLLTLVLPLAASLMYPHESWSGYGQSIMAATGSRRAWWLAKCAWVGLCTVVCWTCVIGVIVVWTLLHGQPLDDVARADSFLSLGVSNEELVAQAVHIAPFTALTLVAELVLAELQLAVSVHVHPVIALAVSIAQIFASSYWQQPFLLGNAATASRWAGMVLDGLPAESMLVVSIAVLVLSVLAGLVLVKRRDIPGRELNL